MRGAEPNNSFVWKRKKSHTSSPPFSQPYWLSGIHRTICQAGSMVVQKKTKPPQHRIVVYQVSEFNHFSKNNSASSKSGKRGSVEQCMGKWEYKWERKRRKILLFLGQARCENRVNHLMQSHSQTPAHEPKFLPKLISVIKKNSDNYLCQKRRWIQKTFG